MKRILYIYRSVLPPILLLLAAGWNAGCSSGDETAELPETGRPGYMSEPIAFSGSIGEDKENVVRAALKDEATVFHLWGFKNMSYDDNGTAADETDDIYAAHQTVFPGYTLTYDAALTGASADNTAGWYYVGTVNGAEQTIKYWDYSAAAYRFFAVTGQKEEIAYGETTGADGALWGNLSFHVKAGIPVYVSELWFSNNAPGQPAYGQPVTLKFRQPLCQVRFMFIDEQGQPLHEGSPVVKSVAPGSLRFRPADISQKIAYGGDITFSYPITGTQRRETCEVTASATEAYDAFTIPYEDQTDVTDYAFVENLADNKKWYTVLPNLNQGAYTMSLTYNGAERTATVPANYMQWRPGHQYTYVFKLGDKAMTFQPYLFVYTEWQAGYTTDKPVKW